MTVKCDAPQASRPSRRRPGLRAIDSMRVVWSKCGVRDRRATILTRSGEAEAWLEGAVVSPTDGGQLTF